MTRCVLFDFDNTLAYTEPLREIRETQQYDLLTPDLLATVKLYRPVMELLTSLRSQGVVMGVVTNSGRAYITKLLDHFGIAEYFQVVVSFSDVKATGMKPSPMGLKLALGRLKIDDPADVLYVGDSNIDLEAAYNAGVVPVLPAWASKDGTSLAPEIEMSSGMLSTYFSNRAEFRLYAERCAELSREDFPRDQLYFLPLDDDANVVTMEKELTTFCLGRYFGQKSAVSAMLHDSHALSKEIIKKEEPGPFQIPDHWRRMFAHVVLRSGESKYTGAVPFDLVTVIPAKQGKDPRLERLLQGVAELCRENGVTAEFEPTIFTYLHDARSQKTLQRNERHREANRSLLITEQGKAKVQGKRLLVIDDVITTGATLSRARSLALAHGAKVAYGVALAKTVSIAAQEKSCGDCSRPMTVAKNKATGERFWSCTGYRDGACKHTEPFYQKECPKCTRPMRLRTNSTTGDRFWGCIGYRATPQCSHTADFDPLESI